MEVLDVREILENGIDEDELMIGRLGNLNCIFSPKGKLIYGTEEFVGFDHVLFNKDGNHAFMIDPDADVTINDFESSDDCMDIIIPKHNDEAFKAAALLEAGLIPIATPASTEFTIYGEPCKIPLSDDDELCPVICARSTLKLVDDKWTWFYGFEES